MRIPLATEALEFAVKHCHKNYIKNKMLALRYLIPIKLMDGIYPSENLLIKYKLTEYIELTKAIQTGDIAKFNEELEKNQEFYVSKGLYLTISKLKYITYRNLFKRTQKIFNSPQMMIAYFKKALEISSNEAVDILEVESILANMISSHYLLGYILHDKQMIVMTKNKDIFPPISDAAKYT